MTSTKNNSPCVNHSLSISPPKPTQNLSYSAYRRRKLFYSSLHSLCDQQIRPRQRKKTKNHPVESSYRSNAATMSHQQERSGEAPAASQTTTDTIRPEATENSPRVILRLRGGHTSNGRSVQWADDVVDNEGLGRKTSKVCCIYHRPKGVDESSDESSSDSSSDSDSDAEPDRKKKVGGDKDDCGHSHEHGHRHHHGRSRRTKGKKRAPSPNAYEKIPKPKPKEADKEVPK
ncbi:phosphatase inhibitor domain-containing protein [Trichoderma barbatum]